MPDSRPADRTAEATAWLDRFAQALEKQDLAAAAALFAVESYWRDLVAFTWTIRTLEGREAIRQMLAAQLAAIRPGQWRLVGAATDAAGTTEAWIAFETAVGRGEGHLRLRDGHCWTLLTALRELKGHEERRGRTRPLGVEHGFRPGRRTWLEQRQEQQATLGITRQPYCVIVGGGQNGLALGARLKRLGVSTLILDRHERPGDAWRKRYKSLCLHDPVWYDHMPYLPFPDHWPVYTPKDQIADWLESYASVMELDIWGGATCRGAAYDAASGEWQVTVERGGETLMLRPKQLVLATGLSGRPQQPALPGAELFKGEQHHSSAHPGSEGWAGKRCVVVGSNNSAHDIAADLVEHGAASVTMVQRAPTLVARSETMPKVGLRALYSEDALARGITTEKADLLFASIPYRVMPALQAPHYREMQRVDAELYERLEARGFLLDWGEDGSGLFMKYLRRGSGYYIDVGASELVADGTIALRSRVEPMRLTEDSVVLSDGSILPADLLVWATGFGPMHEWAADLISPEVAERIGPCWGLGSGTKYDPGPWEGELRNMWKPTAQPGLWFQGGNLHQARHYSLYLALQIKAREAGVMGSIFQPADRGQSSAD